MSINHNLEPKIGDFYYHFKHNPELSIYNYAYKIIGLGMHTETDEIMVVYKPIDKKSKVFENNLNFSIRPVSMFLENVNKPELNYFGSRFNQILDTDIIKKLQTELQI